MDVVFNIQKIKEEGLTPGIYFYLLCLNSNIPYEFMVPSHSQLTELETAGWLKIGPEGPIIREQFRIRFKKYVEINKIEEWIESWRALWPSGVKSAGRPVKGSKQGCITKMSKFIKNHPEVSVEQIFEATRGYLFEKSRVHYQYMTCADYFIEKDSVSLLESLIENNEERGSMLSRIENGGGSFHREI